MARQLTLTDCNFLGPRAEKRKRNAQENKRKYEAKRQRLFLDKWCVDFPGLVFKEEENKMFCGDCCRHPSLADKTSSLFTGNSTFRIQSVQSIGPLQTISWLRLGTTRYDRLGKKKKRTNLKEYGEKIRF